MVKASIPLQITPDPDNVTERILWFPGQPTILLLASRLRITPLDLSEVRNGVNLEFILIVEEFGEDIAVVDDRVALQFHQNLTQHRLHRLCRNSITPRSLCIPVLCSLASPSPQC